MISSDAMRGFNDLLILSILLDHDSYGYEISSTIKKKSEHRYIMKETTLYSAFARLEKNQLIESYSSEVTFGKPRTYYRITPLGRAVYKDKVLEWNEIIDVLSLFIGGDSNGNHF